MSKRVADKEINQDNWDENDEAEEAGKFQQASEDVLKNRVIKTARRRNNIAETTAKPIFSGFSFTSKKPDPETTKKPSSLLFGNNTKSSVSTEALDKPSESKEICVRDNLFFSQIKSLNESVSRWIKEHVDSDPICILTPVFRDYEKHLRDIQESFEKRNESENSILKDTTIPILKDTTIPTSKDTTILTSKETTISTSKDSPVFTSKDITISTSSKNIFSSDIKNSPFSFKSSETQETDKNKSANNNENILKPAESNQKSLFGSSSATFSFGNSTTSLTNTFPSAGFSFGTGAPFKFGNVSTPVAAENSTISKKNEDNAEEEDEPPKVEFKAVIEEDSIYTIRCKVFLKKDDNFVDGGVGNLFLKPIKDKNKTQLIVRADTNLGNLLLNVLLSESIPTQRMGKNNVMMVCIPTPEKATPTSVLLRVKTSEQADELLDIINKHKC